MTKIIQFNNQFNILYSTENRPQAAELSSQGILGRTVFYAALEVATQKQGVIGWEVWFPYKASRP